MTRSKKQQLPPKNDIIRKEIGEDLFDQCIRKGLIEVTPYGYYFTPEFFETLKLYEDD